MAKLSDLTLRYRLFMKTYRYRVSSWAPGVRLEKPLSQARLAVVTTAAFYAPDQDPFDEEIKGGDPSYRVISADINLSSLRIGHRSKAFDHSGIEADPNLALPLDRLREMQREGLIGDLNARHFSFMGSLTAPGRMVARTAPEVASMLTEDHVDGVFLTPV
jgi:D-proline reductase (dithiol) PrdB